MTLEERIAKLDAEEAKRTHYKSVEIADISAPCKYQGVTCYGKAKHMERTEEMIREGSHPHGYTSYGWKIVDGQRVEIRNCGYVLRNVAVKNAY